MAEALHVKDSLRVDARRACAEVENSSAPEALVRLGFVSRGVTYCIVGALALALACGAGTAATPDQQGALALIDRAPLGAVALGVLAIGLLAYALWKLWQGARGYGPEGGGGSSLPERGINLGGGVVYLGFFGVAIGILVSGGHSSGGSGASGGSGGSGGSGAATGVLGWPGGQVLVAIVGVVFVCTCVGQAYQGITGRFLRQDKTREMGRDEQRVIDLLGRIGWVVRAIVFGLIGYFLIRTAVGYDPSNPVGLDGALQAVYRLPLGPALLGFVAAGLIAFGLFALAEARYRRL